MVKHLSHLSIRVTLQIDIVTSTQLLTHLPMCETSLNICQCMHAFFYGNWRMWSMEWTEGQYMFSITRIISNLHPLSPEQGHTSLNGVERYFTWKGRLRSIKPCNNPLTTTNCPVAVDKQFTRPTVTDWATPTFTSLFIFVR